jgi:hypothetical protein
MPNEGIWRSGRRGLVAVLIFAVIVGLLSGWIVTRFEIYLNSLTSSLILGVTLGAVAGPVYGLAFNLTGGRTGMAAFLQHFFLRFFLWKLDLLPWQLVAFLDEATERVLLRKVGGGYTFVHRMPCSRVSAGAARAGAPGRTTPVWPLPPAARFAACGSRERAAFPAVCS